MKSFYSWYRKHITGAIFTGLILGILTGLFLAGRFEPVLTVTSLIGSIYMNALNMMIFPMVFCHWNLFHRKRTYYRQDHCSIHDLFSLHNGTCQPVRTDHPETDPSRKGSQI